MQRLYTRETYLTQLYRKVVGRKRGGKKRILKLIWIEWSAPGIWDDRGGPQVSTLGCPDRSCYKYMEVWFRVLTSAAGIRQTEQGQEGTRYQGQDSHVTGAARVSFSIQSTAFQFGTWAALQLILMEGAGQREAPEWRPATPQKTSGKPPTSSPSNMTPLHTSSYASCYML